MRKSVDLLQQEAKINEKADQLQAKELYATDLEKKIADAKHELEEMAEKVSKAEQAHRTAKGEVQAL